MKNPKAVNAPLYIETLSGKDSVQGAEGFLYPQKRRFIM